MLNVNSGSGKLTLTNVILDGGGEIKTVDIDGGIAYVANGGKLALTDGAVLRNSQISASKNGAGVYLEEGATLNLSGNPSFGDDGNMIGPGTSAKRQDIYIKGYLGVKDLVKARRAALSTSIGTA